MWADNGNAPLSGAPSALRSTGQLASEGADELNTQQGKCMPSRQQTWTSHGCGDADSACGTPMSSGVGNGTYNQANMGAGGGIDWMMQRGTNLGSAEGGLLPGVEMSGQNSLVQDLVNATGCPWQLCSQALAACGNDAQRAVEMLVQQKRGNNSEVGLGGGMGVSLGLAGTNSSSNMLPGALPLPGGLPAVGMPGMLPGAVLPGMSSACASSTDLYGSGPSTEADQTALEEQELLGALAFSLAEQQAESGRASNESADGGQRAALDEARAALKSQQREAELAVAAATQQAAQMEAERAAAIQAAAEAMRQRKEAETQLAAQQQQLQHLQHQQQFAQVRGSFGNNGNASNGGQSGQIGVGSNGQSMCLGGLGSQSVSSGSFGGQQPPLPPQNFGDGSANFGVQANGPAHGGSYGGSQCSGFGGGCGHAHIGGGGIGGSHVGNSPHPIVCEFCGRWLSEMALDQGNHMCDEFWSYNAEFQACGAQCALLVGGVQHLKPEHLQSFAMRFPNMRRVKHGSSAAEFNGLFMLTDEQRQTQALRLLANCNVRTIPLGHAASWRCLHIQLAPSSCPQRVGQAEQSLQNQLLRVMQQRQGGGSGVGAHTEGGGALSRFGGASDAWALRADEAKRRNTEPMNPAQGYGGAGGYGNLMVAGGGPGSTTGDWKCTNCGNINFAFREKCNRCNTPRPGAKLFGPVAANERRICPFTVMLMRVPSHATELQVAEALLTFGELAPGGVKFHRQGAKFKQRRVRVPPDGLALHAFCRFLRPASASAALQRGEVLILGSPVQINPAFMRGAVPADMDGNGTGFGVPPGLPAGIGAPGGNMAHSMGGAGGMGGNMGGGMAGGNMGGGGLGGTNVMAGASMGNGGGNMVGSGAGNTNGQMPPLPSYGVGVNQGNGAMPPLPPMQAIMDATGNSPGVGGSLPGTFGAEKQMQNLQLSMGGLSTNAPAPSGSESAPALDVGNFLGAALPLLLSIDSFRAQVMHVLGSADTTVLGLQSLATALVDSRSALSKPPTLRNALPTLFGDGSGGGQSRLASASSEPAEAFEAFIGSLRTSADQRLVAAVERHCSISLMEMCECVCDEMLEPLQYKQVVSYVSAPLLLSQLSSGTVDTGALLPSQLGSAAGPPCPTANCGQRMKILRYLMPPVPALLFVGIQWDATSSSQPSAASTLLNVLSSGFDLQTAYKSIPQPAGAYLRGLLCTVGIGAVTSFTSYGRDATGSWICYPEGVVVGDDWESVVAHVGKTRSKPGMLLYQVQSSSSQF